MWMNRAIAKVILEGVKEAGGTAGAKTGENAANVANR